ncbi:MAG: PfkB family carbohydrate kinase [Anaerolineales bacterium]
MHELTTFEPVDYLVIGHVTQDVTANGARLGGTAAYAALTARALGMRVGVVTSCSPQINLEALTGIQVVTLPSEHSTTFENRYTQEGRSQTLLHLASPISFESVPLPWHKAPIIHLGPVAQELEAILPRSFAPTLLGLTLQGWLRAWDESGRVKAKTWGLGEQALAESGAVVISIEDVDGDEEQVEFLAQHTRILAVTEGAAGARLYWHGDQRRFRAPHMQEVDATGAGDIFAAALFVRLLTTRDPWEAARFAAQVSARSVTRAGLEGIPTKSEFHECMVEVF